MKSHASFTNQYNYQKGIRNPMLCKMIWNGTCTDKSHWAGTLAGLKRLSYGLENRGPNCGVPFL